MTDDASRRLSPRFETIYATTGRPSTRSSMCYGRCYFQVCTRYQAAGVDGAARPIPAVPLVCWPGQWTIPHGRRPRSHQPSRSAVRRRHCAASLKMLSGQARDADFCPLGTWPCMAPCWTPRLVRRVSNGRTTQMAAGRSGGEFPWGTTADSAQQPARIATGGCSRRRRVTRPSWAISAKY